MALHINTTGWTLDKLYNPIGGKLTFKVSHLQKILKTELSR